MHEFVGRLTPKERLLLFQVSRYLAYHVVQSAPSVELKLMDTPPPPDKLDTRRKAITKLLQGRQGWWLLITTGKAKTHPIPVQLSCNLTRIHVWRDADTLQDSFGWESFTRLAEARVSVERDISDICAALARGCLKQLHVLRYYPWTVVSTTTELQLCQALSAQLTHLHTNDTRILNHIHLFKALHTIKLLDVEITQDVGRSLVEHDTLRMVTFSDLCKLQGDYRLCCCNWHTIQAEPCVLSALPLAGIQQISIAHALWQDKSQLAQLQQILDNHGEKVACVPWVCHHSFCVGVGNLNSSTVMSLLQHASGSVSIIGFASEPWRPNGQITAFWKALPSSINQIELDAILAGDDAHNLWQGMPDTIRSFSMSIRSVSRNELCWLVGSMPAHIKTLVLTGMGGIPAWVLRSLQNVKPAHLELQVR